MVCEIVCKDGGQFGIEATAEYRAVTVRLQVRRIVHVALSNYRGFIENHCSDPELSTRHRLQCQQGLINCTDAVVDDDDDG